MKMRTLALAINVISLYTATALAQKLPPSVTIGTNPAGTVFYAVGAGLAKVISGAGPMQSMVQPYTGTSTLLPLLDSGELEHVHRLTVDLFGPDQPGCVVAGIVGPRQVAVRNGAGQALCQG